MNIISSQQSSGSGIQDVESSRKTEQAQSNNTDVSSAKENATASSEKTNRIYQNAVRCLEIKDYVTCITKLAQVQKIDRYHSRAQYMLGHVYEFHVKNGHKDAVRWYTAAKANGNANAEAALTRVLGDLNPASSRIIMKPDPTTKIKTE